MQLYHEYCLSVQDRDNICSVLEIQNILNQSYKWKKELYLSYYQYDSTINQFGLSNYLGNYYLDKIILDFDKGKLNDDVLLEKAIKFYNRIIEFIPTNNITICFSGTGYHFEMPNLFKFTPSNNLPKIVTATLKKVFPEVDSIFYGRSIIRALGSINLKSNLYKIPLTVDEFLGLTFQGIHNLAKKPRTITSKENPTLVDLSHLVLSDKVTIRNNTLAAVEISNVVTCMQKLYKKGGVQGRRHQDSLRLVSWLRRQSIPVEGVQAMIQSYAPDLSIAEVKQITETYKKNYSYSCKDEVMQEYCDSRCIFYKGKNYTMHIPNIASIEENYSKFIKTNYDDTSFDLANIINTNTEYKFYPGELVIILGDTGIGKTAVIQNFIVSLNKMKTLYLSFEVGQNLLFRRFVQIAHEMNKDDVVDYYKNSNNRLSDKLNHIHIIENTTTLEHIESMINTLNPKIVVVDTIDGITSNVNDMNLKLEKIAVGLKEIAIRTNTIIFGIHHISKSAIKDVFGNAARINKHSGKYASAIEQKADKVIGIEIDSNKENNEKSPVRIITSLKSRDEHPFETKIEIDFTNFKIKNYKEIK